MLASARSMQTAQPAAQRLAARSLFSRASAMPAVALDEEFPAVPATSPMQAAAPQITTSTASSGLQLGSDDREAPVATLGVQLAAGSAYETEATTGISQLFAKMAFRSTTSRSDLRLYRDIEALGGVVQAEAGREFVRYKVSVLPDQLAAAADILAETTLAPKFAFYDVQQQKKLVQAELENLAADAQASVLEGVHAAAFYDDLTLGRPVVSTDNLANLDGPALEAFYETYVNTANAALVGVGLPHQTLTELANEFFASLPQGAKQAALAPKYVGGESRVKKPSAKVTQVALALPTVGSKSADYGASQVLSELLTVRLGNKKASGFLASYDDAALVGLTGSVAPSEAGTLVDAFVAALKSTASKPASKEELAAAKAKAALKACTGQDGLFAQVGKVALSDYSIKAPLEMVSGVTAEKVQALAQTALKSAPSVAAVGSLASVPHVDAVARKLQ